MSGSLPTIGHTMTAPIDLLVVDDDPFVRRGLADIFAASGDIRVVAEADDGDQVPAALAQHRPHVVLMDLKMQRVGGIEAIATVIAEPDPPRVVAMTAPALLAALVVTSVLADGRELGVGLEAVGVAAGGVLLWRGRSVVLAVVVAVAVTAVLRALL